MPEANPHAALLAALWDARRAADEAAVDLQFSGVIAPGPLGAIREAIAAAQDQLDAAGVLIRGR